MLWRSRRWSAVLVCAALGCSAGPSDAGPTGSLSLDLIIADGIEIDEVQWEVSGGDMEPMSGVVNTSAPGSTASVEIFGIPPGGDYLIQMEATATDGETTCKGSATFDIQVGELTNLHVMLNCKRPPRFGAVRVNGELNHCAELIKVVVSPLQTSVGNAIDLFSDAIDDEGDTITYVWSGSGGTIANPNAPATRYTCDVPGAHQLRVVVSDDDFTHCMSEWTVDIACVATDTGCLTDADCDDGASSTQCLVSRCNEATGLCEDETLPDGTDCSAENPPLASCQGGVCSPDGCRSDADCGVSDQCFVVVCFVDIGFCEGVGLEGFPCSLPGVLNATCSSGECIDTTCTSDDQCDPPTQCRKGGVCDVKFGRCDLGAPVENGEPCERHNGDPGVCFNTLCGCADDSVCSPGSECAEPSTCELETGRCIPGGAINFGGPCNYRERGPETGQCGNHVCLPICFRAPCPDNGIECVEDICDHTDGSCNPVNEVSGQLCDFDAQRTGSCDGVGSCVLECASEADCDE